MKFNTIVKLFTALAAAVGAVYIIATYGDKIVNWAKRMMNGCCAKPVMNAPEAEAEESDFVQETAQEEAPAETQERPEPAEASQEPVLADDIIPVADEDDFEG